MIRPAMMLILLLFLHSFADYHLQGILAEMKQKNWWIEQVDEKSQNFYKDDYKIALFIHAFEWSFVVSIPIFLYAICNGDALTDLAYLIVLCANAGLHYVIDDAKANKKVINLVIDQSFHALQILLFWIAWLLVYRG